jgi:hypothetical protein
MRWSADHHDVAPLALVVAVGALACSSPSAPNPLRPGQSASCTANLSGELTGTFDCRPASTALNNDRPASFQLSVVSETDGVQQIELTVIIFFAGGPVPATYTRASLDGDIGGVVVTSTGGTWSTARPGGSYQLTFANFSNPVTYPEGTLYSANGLLEATLEPTGGNSATGTVLLHTTF